MPIRNPGDDSRPGIPWLKQLVDENGMFLGYYPNYINPNIVQIENPGDVEYIVDGDRVDPNGNIVLVSSSSSSSGSSGSSS